MSNKITSGSELKHIAREIRVNIIKSISIAGSGHTGGSLGMADIFTYLYFNQLNHNPKIPNWDNRDRLILSIGHIAPVLYASLAQAGYFDKEELKTLRRLGSRLQGHPGKDHNLPGIEVSSGSLGQGLSVAVGLALGGKIDKRNWKVYSIHGDGELQEGSIWEAAMSASHFQLNNLVAIVDRNHLQIDGKTKDVMEIEPLTLKWESFGWNVFHCDGHDFSSIMEAFSKANLVSNNPSVIIAETKMGKGIKEIENDYRWHGKAPSKDQAIRFINELKNSPV